MPPWSRPGCRPPLDRPDASQASAPAVSPAGAGVDWVSSPLARSSSARLVVGETPVQRRVYNGRRLARRHAVGVSRGRTGFGGLGLGGWPSMSSATPCGPSRRQGCHHRHSFRCRVRAAGLHPPFSFIDVNGTTLVAALSDKEGTGRTYKHGYGFFLLITILHATESCWPSNRGREMAGCHSGRPYPDAGRRAGATPAQWAYK
jgi:hypothetical protein